MPYPLSPGKQSKTVHCITFAVPSRYPKPYTTYSPLIYRKRIGDTHVVYCRKIISLSYRKKYVSKGENGDQVILTELIPERRVGETCNPLVPSNLQSCIVHHPYGKMTLTHCHEYIDYGRERPPLVAATFYTARVKKKGFRMLCIVKVYSHHQALVSCRVTNKSVIPYERPLGQGEQHLQIRKDVQKALM